MQSALSIAPPAWRNLPLALWGLLLAALAVALAVARPAPAPAGAEGPAITIEARQFAYSPGVITVRQGERVHVDLLAMDVTHGLRLDGYDVDLTAYPGKPASIEFVADRPGRFRIRCTQPCGDLHPFMVGELIVEPDTPFPASLALVALAAVAGLVWAARRPLAAPGDERSFRYDLMQLRPVRWLLTRRWLQFALVLPMLAFYILAIFSGLFGSAVGNASFAIIFVWIVWWALLKLLFIPLGARAWCAMCPIPAPGEWLQRRSFVGVGGGKLHSLGKKWPARLRNTWLQNAAFLLLALFSAFILTRPWLSGVIMLGFLVIPLGLALVFERRVFCRYLCPVGGFIGLFALTAPLEIRVKDRAVCAAHKEKECLRGSECGYGCPWLEYPGRMERNLGCGMCTECIKTCPKGNIAVNVRPFGRDLLVKDRRADEAATSFIMLGAALLYSAVMLGPWGWMKSLAYFKTGAGFAAYAGIVLAATLVALPGALLGLVWMSERFERPPRVSALRLVTAYAYGLAPLGLLAWIAFSLDFVFGSAGYALRVASDPFGWGWNLFGTALLGWAPYLPEVVPYLQVAALGVGVAWSVAVSYRIVLQELPTRERALRGVAPVVFFIAAVAMLFVKLFLG